MSIFFTVEDGTQYQVEKSPSGRSVLVGFKPSELEKLLALKENAVVMYDGAETTYGEMRRDLGEFIAYFQNVADYEQVRHQLL